MCLRDIQYIQTPPPGLGTWIAACCRVTVRSGFHPLPSVEVGGGGGGEGAGRNSSNYVTKCGVEPG